MFDFNVCSIDDNNVAGRLDSADDDDDADKHSNEKI